MVEIHKNFHGRVVFLMVNTAESVATIERFKEKVGIPGTVLMDPTDRVGELYGTKILPSLFFIDASGEIRAAIPGALKDIDAFMERMLDLEPGSTG